MANSTEGYDPRWLAFEAQLGARPLFSGSPEEILQQFKGVVSLVASQLPPPDPSVVTYDTTANDGPIPVRIYTPQHAKGKLPIGVYFHGGGWMVGDLDSEDAWCRYISKNTPCIIVSVAYSLSPAYKMPTQLQEGVLAYHWVHNNAEQLGGDIEKVFTIGASAGGALALTVADQLVKGQLRKHICGVVALVPVTTHPTNPPAELKSLYNSYTENGTGVPIIDYQSMQTFFTHADIQPDDEKTFVTLSKNLADFPPVYIATCGKDPLRDDGLVLEVMLGERGVRVHRDHHEGFPHYFWLFPSIPGGEVVLEKAVRGIHQLFDI